MPWGLYVLLDVARCLPKRDYTPPWVRACVSLRVHFSFLPSLMCSRVRLPTCMRPPTHLHAYACSLAYLSAPACACVYACLHLYVHTPVCVWAHPYVRDNPPAPYPISRSSPTQVHIITRPRVYAPSLPLLFSLFRIILNFAL